MEGVRIEATVNVPVTDVSLSKNSLTLQVDEVSELTATDSPDDATNKKVSWESTNTAVAEVCTVYTRATDTTNINRLLR